MGAIKDELGIALAERANNQRQLIPSASPAPKYTQLLQFIIFGNYSAVFVDPKDSKLSSRSSDYLIMQLRDMYKTLYLQIPDIVSIDNKRFSCFFPDIVSIDNKRFSCFLKSNIT